MKKIEYRYIADWDPAKGGWVFATGYKIINETPEERAALKHAAEQIEVQTHELDYPGRFICAELTASGLAKLNEALANPRPTRRERQNARVFEKFLSLMS